MSNFNSLSLILKNWFDKPLSDIPDKIRQRIMQDLNTVSWDDLNPAQRRKAVLQMNCQHKHVGEKACAEYIAYPKAMKLLIENLNATPEELAAWIFCGPELGGIAAYTNANELDPPPRFYFSCFSGSDYHATMMSAWFLKEDIRYFKPKDRYLTGQSLIDRWSKYSYIKPRDFIIAKIQESRLIHFHPISGILKETFSECENFPPIEAGLFDVSSIKAIEEEDLALTQTNTLKSKAPQAFIDALIKLLKEIECRSSAKRTTINKSCMPGTKANLQIVASKFDAALDGFSPQTFDDYLEGICQFKKGRPPINANNPYAELFPEFF